MPMSQLKQAVVDSVEHDAYPEPEVSSAELPPTLLPALLADLQTARDEVKVRKEERPQNGLDADCCVARHT